MNALTKVILISVFIFICLPNSILAQAPDTFWTNTFGGVENDYGNAVQLAADGGFIVVGFTESFGAGFSDVWLIKTDQYGNEEWNKTFGGNSSDRGYAVQRSGNDGYVIVGRTRPLGVGDSYVWLIKTDNNGNEVWNKTYGDSSEQSGFSVQQTFDGGYIITGYHLWILEGSSDVLLIKTDESGNEIWYNTLGGVSSQRGNSVQQTPDEGYIIAGITYSSNTISDDVLLLKTDQNGNEIWRKTFGGSLWDGGHSVQITTDGGYIIAGYTDYDIFTQERKAWLIKTDENGNEVWNKKFGISYYSRGYFATQTNDGGYILIGNTYNEGFSTDILLVKTDETGNEVWNKTIGGTLSEWGYSVQQTLDGGYIMTGRTESFGAGEDDVWLIKLEPDSTVNVNGKTILLDFQLEQNYPNPFNPTTTIKYQIPEVSFVTIKVYDVLGNEIATLVNEQKPADSYEVEFDASGLPSGIYFYRLQAGSFVEAKKMVLMK